MHVRKFKHPTYTKVVMLEEHFRSCWERCDHVSFLLIITGVAMYVRKVANPKYLKMVIIEKHIRSCFGNMFLMIVKLI